MSARAAALDYAGRGWPVFPCKPGRKDPLTINGKDNATTDPDRIRAWWSRWPYANVAIRTGTPAVDVLDVDVREEGNGWPAFNRLVRAGVLAGAVRLVRTRSGGLHVYFAGTEQGCRKLIGLFIDFKATGGYVLAPPSVVDGKPYDLLEDRAGEARPLDFARVERILCPPKPRASERRTFSGGDVGPLARWLAKQQEGNRNSALFWAANKAAKAGLGDGDFAELVQVAVSIGLTQREAELTVRSALRRLEVGA